jgi:precorrin-2/cobalt-factor-2 C20-methyltransferase
MKSLQISTMQPQPGHFYAVGIGPGSPDMLTVRAARLVEGCDTIITPQAKGSSKSLALEAVHPFVGRQEIIVNNYPMERNGEKSRKRWHLFAEDVARRCAAGESIVQITLGDPLIFATSSYLLQSLSEMMPAANIHVVPGISAFQIAASRFAETLTLQEDRLMLMSATDLSAVERALGQCETLVLYKAGTCIDALMDLLCRHNLLDRARLVSCCEQGERELVLDDLPSWQAQPLNYMTTMIVRIGNRPWAEG